MKTNYFWAAIYLFIAFLVTACGGGGGGGGGGFGLNGGPVSGALSTTVPTQTYTFNAVADTTYTVSTVTTAGDITLAVYNGSQTTGTLIGFPSWNSLATTPYNSVSFIANFTGLVTVVVTDVSINSSFTALNPSSYTLQASDGNLTIGTARTASTYNGTMNYSFDATNGTAYRVQVTPQSGDVNIGSVNAKLTASVGSSMLTGTAVDTVTFVAPGTQRYYVQVTPTSVDTTFSIKVVTTTTAPDLRAVVNSAVSDGTNVTVNYTVYNQGINATPASFNVDGWSNSASAPTVGMTGATATQPALAGGASATGSLVIPDTGASGTAYVIVDTTNAVAESDETNNVSAGKAWVKPLLAPQSFNFENAVVPAGMTMSGNASWVIDSTTGGASTHSLKAGTIGNSQTTCTAMSVAAATTISFDYAVSSEAGFDFLNFYIDGVQQPTPNASGTVTWTNSGPIAVTAGTHEYKWCYTKDISFSAGSDTAWIDNILIN